MFYQRVFVSSSHGAQIPMDVYVPHVSEVIDPAIKRPAVVICPGGGYRMCSEREAEPVALRFLTEGFNAFVLWYRVHSDDEAGQNNVFPMMQHDAAAAIAHVRKHAQAYHTDPDRIAILGFSAGGHLAASVAGLWQHEEMWQPLGLTSEEVRPNAAVLCYPVIAADEDAHRGSFEHLTGTDDVTKHQAFSALNWVTEQYPPTFLWHTFADATVPVQNSLRMGLALARHGVRAELHIFPEGQHGLSLANTQSCHRDDLKMQQAECTVWPALAARFLNTCK